MELFCGARYLNRTIPFFGLYFKSYMSAFGLRAQACVNPALRDPCKRFDPGELELTMTKQPLLLCVKLRKITISMHSTG